jgi:hypothetical protein
MVFISLSRMDLRLNFLNFRRKSRIVWYNGGRGQKALRAFVAFRAVGQVSNLSAVVGESIDRQAMLGNRHKFVHQGWYRGFEAFATWFKRMTGFQTCHSSQVNFVALLTD